MEDAYKTIHSKLGKLADECAELLDDSEDPDEWEELLHRLSSAFIAGASFLRFRMEDEENAANHLVTDAFAEVVRCCKPTRPSELDGFTVVHAPGRVSPDGVSLCQDWTIRYSAKVASSRAHPEED